MATNGTGIGAGVINQSENGPPRTFQSDLGWNDLQRAWFRDTPRAIYNSSRTRAAIRKQTGGGK